MIHKIKYLLIIAILLVCVGCQKASVNDKKGVLQCSRTGSIDGATSQMFYELYYSGDYLTVLHSTEQVISDDQVILDTYEDAYKNIYKSYENLKYYDAKVIRDNDSVRTDVTINYEKIDIDKLLEIEGEEDNVIGKDGKVKLETWLDFAEPFGVKCE